ncbi:MAG: response regulator transcription factor [Granulosicoccus sp.]
MSNQQVFILDDNANFRESTAFLLEALGYEVSHFGAYNEALKAMADVPKEQAACLLLDIRMPELSGLDVHDLMQESNIDLPVIYMTAHGDVPLAVSAMKKGALTFLEKPLEDDALKSSLEQALSDQVQSNRTSAAEREALADAKRKLESLTPRELQVTRCIVNKLSNKQIASELDISVKTVELHRSRSMHKLGAKNAAHLVSLVLSCELG